MIGIETPELYLKSKHPELFSELLQVKRAAHLDNGYDNLAQAVGQFSYNYYEGRRSGLVIYGPPLSRKTRTARMIEVALPDTVVVSLDRDGKLPKTEDGKLTYPQLQESVSRFRERLIEVVYNQNAWIIDCQGALSFPSDDLFQRQFDENWKGKGYGIYEIDDLINRRNGFADLSDSPEIIGVGMVGGRTINRIGLRERRLKELSQRPIGGARVIDIRNYQEDMDQMLMYLLFVGRAFEKWSVKLPSPAFPYTDDDVHDIAKFWKIIRDKGQYRFRDGLINSALEVLRSSLGLELGGSFYFDTQDKMLDKIRSGR